MARIKTKSVLLAVLSFAAGMLFQSNIEAQNNGFVSFQSAQTKFESTVVSVRNARDEQMANQSAMQHDVQLPPTTPIAAPSTNAPVIKEIIPPSLHSLYTPSNLAFNITRSMLKRSRPIIGNNERLHSYIAKLHSGLCTVVLFLGGSVTDGHHVKGRANEAYPAHFMKWLNAKYPCVNEDGEVGEHLMKKTYSQNSQTHFINWSMVTEIEKIALVLIEFNVNDSFINDIPHALEKKGEGGVTSRELVPFHLLTLFTSH
jgi:hypothetical protein